MARPHPRWTAPCLPVWPDRQLHHHVVPRLFPVPALAGPVSHCMLCIPSSRALSFFLVRALLLLSCPSLYELRLAAAYGSLLIHAPALWGSLPQPLFGVFFPPTRLIVLSRPSLCFISTTLTIIWNYINFLFVSMFTCSLDDFSLDCELQERTWPCSFLYLRSPEGYLAPSKPS